MFEGEPSDGPPQESWLEVLIIVCVTVTLVTLAGIVFLAWIGVLA